MKHEAKVMKNVIGYIKNAGISKEDFPFLLFFYEWMHIRESGMSPLHWGVKFFTGPSPMIVPGWIMEAYELNDGQYNLDYFSPRQLRILKEVIEKNILETKQHWADFVTLIGEDIEVNFYELAEKFGWPAHLINRIVDDYEFYVLNFPVDLRFPLD